MKRTNDYPRRTGPARNARGSGATDTTVRDAVAKTKQRLLAEYREHVGEHLRVLRLALNEAEALAWSTEFPHLFFPALAVEKALAVVKWQRRQRAVRGASTELAFAE